MDGGERGEGEGGRRVRGWSEQQQGVKQVLHVRMEGKGGGDRYGEGP